MFGEKPKYISLREIISFVIIGSTIFALGYVALYTDIPRESALTLSNYHWNKTNMPNNNVRTNPIEDITIFHLDDMGNFDWFNLDYSFL